MELVTKLAEYVVPAIVALLASTFGPALLTAAKLRRDLSSDAEILAGLPSDVQTALRADMARRARLLITYSKDPSITLPDLASLLGMLVLAVWWVFMCIEIRNGEVLDELGPGLVFGAGGSVFIAMIGLWLTFYGRWSKRAGRRLAYIEEHIGQDEAIARALVLRLADR